jgi:predicted secreted protein
MHLARAGRDDVLGALAWAEDAVRRGNYRKAIHRVERATDAFVPSPPVRGVVRLRTLAAAALIAAMLAGSAAALERTVAPQRPAGNSAAAIHIADTALTAANNVNDPRALVALVTTVQDTIADLATQARSNPSLRAQLDALASRQEQLVASNVNVPAAVVARAHAIVQAVQSLAPAPEQAPPPSGAASPLG